MKALFIRQPYTAAVVDGHKLVENRGDGYLHFVHRGLVAIGAPKLWHPRCRGSHMPRVFLDAYPVHTDEGWSLRNLPPLSRHSGRPPEPFTASAIVGVAQLVDIHPGLAGCGCDPAWAEEVYTDVDGNEVGAVAHLVFAEPRRIPHPVPVGGHLGLRDLPGQVAEAVEDQLAGQ